MNATNAGDRVLAGLADRLRTVAPQIVDGDVQQPSGNAARDAGELLTILVEAVQQTLTPDRVWLLLVAVYGSYPESDDIQEAARILELATPIEAIGWMLDACLIGGHANGTPSRGLAMVVGGVVVDVDRAAKHNYHTGIQQVIRKTMPYWHRSHDITLAAWTWHEHALRAVTDDESNRVLQWDRIDQPIPRATEDDDYPIIVPWRCVVLIADIPTPRALRRLAAIGAFSGNALTAIGYDAIPIVSAHLVPVGAAEHHARYLAAIKHARRIATISTTAEAEYRGFAAMLPSQGVQGPIVTECSLPAEQTVDLEPPSASAPPTVLCVGSLEPRKNHLALLFAAEVLWREGHAFRLRLIGGNRWGDEITEVIDGLIRSGRSLTVEVGVPQAKLHAAFKAARFTVFPSLHEGYGLPVAESLSFGIPAITSSFGSTAEIAAGGGVVTVDPRDDDALISAMRQLLTDDSLVSGLRKQIVARRHRGWDDYAGELWDELVANELSRLG